MLGPTPAKTARLRDALLEAHGCRMGKGAQLTPNSVRLLRAVLPEQCFLIYRTNLSR